MQHYLLPTDTLPDRVQATLWGPGILRISTGLATLDTTLREGMFYPLRESDFDIGTSTPTSLSMGSTIYHLTHIRRHSPCGVASLPESVVCFHFGCGAAI